MRKERDWVGGWVVVLAETSMHDTTPTGYALYDTNTNTFIRTPVSPPRCGGFCADDSCLSWPLPDVSGPVHIAP